MNDVKCICCIFGIVLPHKVVVSISTYLSYRRQALNLLSLLIARIVRLNNIGKKATNSRMKNGTKLLSLYSSAFESLEFMALYKFS
jgi:hypothetical protein